MPDFNYKEIKLEEAIESHLINHGGYTKGDASSFDPVLGLDTKTLIAFIKSSQPKKWKDYKLIYGTDSERSFVNRFNKEVRQVGLLNVLRHSLKDRGISFNIVFWKPETSINIDSKILFDKNILHCTRQLYYSPSNKNSIDIVLFLNGIPVVTMELKNQLTGQSIWNAMEQYRKDRGPNDAIFAFKQRSLVNFCVDLHDVMMTTELKGDKTFFLPFNQGSNGAGNVGTKGNPLRKDNYQTAYLWEDVLEKDRLLEILHKYMHYDKEENRMIFPRYHQLDIVTKLLDDVKKADRERIILSNIVLGVVNLTLSHGWLIVYRVCMIRMTIRYLNLL